MLPGGAIGKEMRALWPGPYTWIVPARPEVLALLTGGRPTIAVRVSAHPIVQRLCRRTGSALVSTSANLSGAAPARTALAVRTRLGREVDFVLAGELGKAERPTEIRDSATGAVLRAG
jgi:L-threonylcarbamoyladenylate synthase